MENTSQTKYDKISLSKGLPENITWDKISKRPATSRYFEDIIDYNRGTPEELYNLYMSSEKHTALFRKNTKISEGIGDSVLYYNPTSYKNHIHGRNLRVIPNCLVIQTLRSNTWNKDLNDAIIIIKFIEFKGGTRIQLVNANLPEKEKQVIDRGMFFDLWRTYIIGKKDIADAYANKNNMVNAIKLFLSNKELLATSIKETAKLIEIDTGTKRLALKELYKKDILKRKLSIICHRYKLDRPNITVKNIRELAFSK